MDCPLVLQNPALKGDLFFTYDTQRGKREFLQRSKYFDHLEYSMRNEAPFSAFSVTSLVSS